MKEVTLRTTPHTVHLVKSPLLPTWSDGVTTWCERRGTPYEPTVSAWRRCRLCEKNKKKAEKGAT